MGVGVLGGIRGVGGVRWPAGGVGVSEIIRGVGVSGHQEAGRGVEVPGDM